MAAAIGIRTRGYPAGVAERCIAAGVSTGNLAPATDVAGLTALYDGLVLGVSIQARDGVPAETLRAGIAHAMAAWDMRRTGLANCID
ncbi:MULTISPECIES: hypothetical protein [unclassified Sphingomonas]|uniref:hypothetical protein n=1 Tax=Sphingomonas sp. PvP015 TaxID=3156388 RepID=UPI003399A2F1